MSSGVAASATISVTSAVSTAPPPIRVATRAIGRARIAASTGAMSKDSHGETP